MNKVEKINELAENTMKVMARNFRSPGDNLRAMALIKKYKRAADEIINPPRKRATVETAD